MLGVLPGGSPALKEIRAAYDGPIMLAAAYSGTFWLEATPHLSNAGSRLSARATATTPEEINEFFRRYEEKTGEAALVDSYPLLGYSLVQTIAKGIEIAGTTDGSRAREGARDLRGRATARGADDVHGGPATCRWSARC